MPFDRSLRQIHLKFKGFQIYFFYCKFTKVPVLWQCIDPDQMQHSAASDVGPYCLFLFLVILTKVHAFFF